MQELINILKDNAPIHYKKQALIQLKNISYDDIIANKDILDSILSSKEDILIYYVLDIMIEKGIEEFSNKIKEISLDKRKPLFIRQKAIKFISLFKNSENINLLFRLLKEPHEILYLEAMDGLVSVGLDIVDFCFKYLNGKELDFDDKKKILNIIIELDFVYKDKLRKIFLDFIKQVAEEDIVIIMRALKGLNADNLVNYIRKNLPEIKLDYSYSLEYILKRFSKNKERIQDIVNKISYVDKELAIKIMVALKKMEEDDFSLFERLLFSDLDSYLLSMLVIILGLLETKKVLPYLINFLHHPERRVRANAIESLSMIPDIDEDYFIDLVLPLIEDYDNRVKANAAKALWKKGGLHMIDVLKKMVKSDDKWMKASAAYVLGEIGVYQVVDILLELLYSDDVDVKRNAIVALGKTKESDIIAPLSRIVMNDKEEFFLRKLAIEAIKNVNNKEATDTLLRIANAFSDDPAIYNITYSAYKEIK